MEKLIKILKDKNETISCMESCTGGQLASEITNINGSSNIFKLGLVTYSNEWKQYFGVNKQSIETYTVYSINVAQQMAHSVCNLTKSNWAIGITGMIGEKDLNNKSNDINTVYISIYNSDENEYYNFKINPAGNNKLEKKIFIINYIKEQLYEICK